MLFVKVTEGVVLQMFNETGECVGQKFVCGDKVTYETMDGFEISSKDMPLTGNEYHPFVMEQPLKNQPKVVRTWVNS